MLTMNLPASLPLVVAHGPPVCAVLPFMLLFLGLGAVLPPLLYLRPKSSRWWVWSVLRVLLGVLLNVYAFAVYAQAAWYVCEVEFYDKGAAVFMLAAIIVFLAVEFCVLLRRWLKNGR